MYFENSETEVRILESNYFSLQLYTNAYAFSTALECPWLFEALVVILTEPPCIVAVLVNLFAWRLCERLSPSPPLPTCARCKEPPGWGEPVFTYTTKFVSITSDGPPLSRGIGLARKCSNISKMLWNQRCCTRHWPSTFRASLRCWQFQEFVQKKLTVSNFAKSVAIKFIIPAKGSLKMLKKRRGWEGGGRVENGPFFLQQRRQRRKYTKQAGRCAQSLPLTSVDPSLGTVTEADREQNATAASYTAVAHC